MIDRAFRILLILAALVGTTSCGGGGSAAPATPPGGIGPVVPPPSPPPPPPPTPQQPPEGPSYVNFSSDAGDRVGQGLDYSYSNVDSVITVSSTGAYLVIEVEGDEAWRGDLQLPDSYALLQIGTYTDLKRYGNHDAAIGGMSWTGAGGFCSQLDGWMVIDEVTYDGTLLTGVDLRFEQRCDGNPAALQGEVHWDATDTTVPPGPVNPLPAGLWEPGPGLVPDTGNYIFLQSQPGDWVGAGGTYIYTEADALITTSTLAGRLSVTVRGDERWGADFATMYSLEQLEAGYYGDLRRYPFHNAAKGGMNWSGEGRGCNEVDGWFVVDAVTYNGTVLEAIDLRFEQHCDGDAAGMFGAIRWDANDSTMPAGPVVPPPPGLWEPPTGATPATGNYLYVESEPGDNAGAGETALYTQLDSVFSVVSGFASADVFIDGDEKWFGQVRAMSALNRLEVGYYGDATTDGGNPTKGGMNWGANRGCNIITGWFVIDGVTYDGPNITAIDLRFEQHCEGVSAALYGEFHWDINDNTVPPGPVVPAPAGLWEPASGATPAAGSYVYLESEPGDFIGGGDTYLYTLANAEIVVDTTNPDLHIEINGDENWDGEFQAMFVVSRLEEGYYGALQRYPFHNPAKGGMSWYGEGRACNKLDAWFVVDKVVYDGVTMTELELRFEQYCEGYMPPLRGKIHWIASDPTTPPGPVTPPPADLWEPTPGITPATGNFVYLTSEQGDWIGGGGNYLHTDANSQIDMTTSDAYLEISVDGDAFWIGRFAGMSHLNQLAVGYYGDLQRYPFQNPTKGSLAWTGEGRACNTLNGWFVVDSISYDGPTLSSIELRFEQHCEGDPPALNGQIRWSQ